MVVAQAEGGQCIQFNRQLDRTWKICVTKAFATEFPDHVAILLSAAESSARRKKTFQVTEVADVRSRAKGLSLLCLTTQECADNREVLKGVRLAHDATSLSAALTSVQAGSIGDIKK